MSNALVLGILLVAGQALLLIHSAEHVAEPGEATCFQCLTADHLQSVVQPPMQVVVIPPASMSGSRPSASVADHPVHPATARAPPVPLIPQTAHI